MLLGIWGFDVTSFCHLVYAENIFFDYSFLHDVVLFLKVMLQQLEHQQFMNGHLKTTTKKQTANIQKDQVVTEEKKYI